MKLIIVSVLLIFVQNSQQVELQCEYSLNSCTAKNFHTSYDDRKITEVTGNLITGTSKKDIRALIIEGQNCPFLPLDISQHFPNLEKLSVTKSNVQHLMSDDLDGLENLDELILNNNPIEQIGHDFFLEKSKITSISFNYCHLKKIDAEALEPLTSLYSADFHYNECIDENVSDRSGIASLKRLIKRQCQGMQQILKPKISQTCENTSKSYLNISIILIITSFTMFSSIFTFLLIRVYRNNFKGNWAEMKRHLLIM